MAADNYQKFGNYILLDRINVGGMAEVFRGKQVGVEGFTKMVALKRILPNISADQDFIDMFIDEAKLAVAMQHANIVQIYDLGQVDETYYIAMEYIPGVDVRTIWDRARRRNRLLPIAMSCYLMQRVCEGLDFAHRKKDDFGQDIGLVHRDVSPQNVLVSFEGEAKVVDFGIAKAKNKISKTQAGILKGKFGYMSPEQVRGIELDNRSDIFACGAVLYELLVGERLFLGESDFSTLEKVRNVEFVPPSQLNKNLSPQVERIVMKCLQKNRDDRYRYCSEVAEDLQRYLFASNQPFQRTDLQRYMKQHFKVEIDKEYARLEKYRGVSLADLEPDPPPPPPPPQPVAPPPAEVPAALAPRPMTMGSLGQQQPGMPELAPGMTSSPGMPSGVPHNGAGGGMPGAMPAAQGVPAQAGLPTWAKGLIGGLTLVVLLTLGLVVYLLLVKGGIGNPGGTGSLTIDVTPTSAEILVDSKSVSTTSPFTVDLPTGTHVLEVRKTGFKRVLRPVKIVAGDARLESIELEPEGVKSSVVVKSTPEGLAIWVDGADTGKTTPSTFTDILPGQHELVLKQGADTVYSAPLSLDQGGVEAVDVDISRLPPVLDVKASRSGARVFIDDRSVGTTPARIDTLSPGSVIVKIEAEGCETYEAQVDMRAAVVSNVDAKLVCAGGGGAAAQATGKLNVSATIVADIFLDGDKVGRTPALGLAVPPGVHTLKLVPLAGDKPPHAASIRIESGETTSVSHRF